MTDIIFRRNFISTYFFRLSRIRLSICSTKSTHVAPVEQLQLLAAQDAHHQQQPSALFDSLHQFVNENVEARHAVLDVMHYIPETRKLIFWCL
jgi:hypothetical protein